MGAVADGSTSGDGISASLRSIREARSPRPSSATNPPPKSHLSSPSGLGMAPATEFPSRAHHNHSDNDRPGHPTGRALTNRRRLLSGRDGGAADDGWKAPELPSSREPLEAQSTGPRSPRDPPRGRHRDHVARPQPAERSSDPRSTLVLASVRPPADRQLGDLLARGPQRRHLTGRLLAAVDPCGPATEMGLITVPRRIPANRADNVQ
jgi:hypothetical protein